MRLFIAIRLNDHLTEALVKTQKDAEALGIGGRMTARKNMHVTLAFIGEFEKPANVIGIMKSITHKPFEIETCGICYFGDILCGKVKVPDELKKYVAKLRQKLADAGIPYDPKPFNPHITLARKVTGRPDELTLESRAMKVGYISLMKSARNRLGEIEYTEIGRA